jgi:hypothetical protein
MGFRSRVADFARRRSGESDDRLWGEWAGGGQSNAGMLVNSITAIMTPTNFPTLSGHSRSN